MRNIDRRQLCRRGLRALAGVTLGEFLQRQRGAAQGASADYAFDVTSGFAGCSEIALMFNVGAGYEPAVGIFDILGGYGIACSMFVMGWLADQNPSLVQQMANWGHAVGSHGYLPPELTVRSDDDVINDLQAAAGSLQWALGYDPGPWLTPFAGSSDSRVRALANSIGLITVGYSVGSDDWSPDATADSIYNRVVGGAFDGAIVELHLDAQQSINGTAVALPWIIDDLSAQGYRFVTVPQIAAGC